MITILNKCRIGLLAVLVSSIASCDKDPLEIQNDFPFEVKVMPIPKEIANGQTVEIRITLQRTGNYNNTHYYIRYFQYDGAKHCLIGEHSRKVYRLGDKVTVQVASVSLDERRINLTLSGDVAQDRYARRRGDAKGHQPASVRSQLKRGKIPGKKADAKEPGELSGRSEQGKTKPKKNSASRGKKKPAGKSADAGTSTTAKKPKRKAVKKPKRPGKNARKSKSSGASDT